MLFPFFSRAHLLLLPQGTAAAVAGSLTFMCGGEASTLEAARPLLEAMGPKVFFAGSAGSGQVAKACNNMLLAIHMIGTCEALEMGERHGVDPEVLFLSLTHFPPICHTPIFPYISETSLLTHRHSLGSSSRARDGIGLSRCATRLLA